ncbi:hypothetical protein HG536_0G02550 [Torulaspora globosa]|uniref:BHLH domain-containing protein n=1 Tax=Torulaspora globosa TaxID=48254 RepID=A0A7G3ZLK8_9SACH|nr:uncharacterized protein HG536_0G02550 [Torulaspora globosa]QLL34394.1 hypothetical protein HG536_0G02550 [Torulaspora globosa]
MTSVPGSVSSSVTSTASNQLGKVDRKRRDNINERIQQLLTMIPSEFFQEYYKSTNGCDSENGSGDASSSATPKPNASSAKMKSTGTRDGKPNKGQILTQAVEYIMSLQNDIDTRNREEVELILKVQELSNVTGTIVNDINLENTSAEIALAKIGVGTLAGEVPPESDQTRQGSQSSRHPAAQYNPHISNFEYGGYAEYGDGN